GEVVQRRAEHRRQPAERKEGYAGHEQHRAFRHVLPSFGAAGRRTTGRRIGDNPAWPVCQAGMFGREITKSSGGVAGAADAPKEIRTPVLALKGPRPTPLDDGGA